jgi:hypothetical protein
MISPKLTAVMVAMTALVIPTVPAWAQAANVNEIGDLTNAAEINTGGNVQANVAETTQAADNSIEIENEAESGDAEAEGGNAEADDNEVEAEAKAESESDGKYKGGDSEANADAEAELENEGGDATAVQLLNDVQFNNDVTQDSTTTQTNALSDDDAVVVAQTNVPVQVQDTPVAIDLDLLLDGVL